MSRSSSLQTRRTYTVTIRDRKVEALTEFPNANPPLETPPRPSRDRTDSFGQMSKYPPVTPKDQNRLNVLRQDPSVASLLNMYDNQGHLDSKVFSNTPTASEKEPYGRAQLKRGGSTLRQLLGSPGSSHRASTADGDISWAEAFLQYDTSSFPFWSAIDPSRTLREAGRGNDESISSICLETRTDAVVGSSNNPLSSDRPPVGFTTRHAISSMAVEHSYTSNESSTSYPQQPTKPETRPAAEVFGFLLEKRRRSASMPLSVEPTSNLLPATRNINLPTNHTRTTSATAIKSKPSQSLSNTLQPGKVSASTDTPSSIGDLSQPTTTPNYTRIPRARESLADGPPIVTVTATRPSRIPRGRLSLQLNPETQLLTTSSKGPAPTPNPNNYDILRSATNTAHVATSQITSTFERDITAAPAPKRNAHRRSVSSGMSRQIPNSWRAVPAATGAAHPKGFRADDGKENTSNPVSTAKNAGLCTFSF